MSQSDVLDSPWFWSLIFSAIGLAGVWAISGKYDDRQKRLEARYEARQRIADRSDAQRAQSSAAAPGNVDAQGVETNEAPSEIQSEGYPDKRVVPLRFLAAGLAILSLVSAGMLWRNARRLPR
jgi:hypothetical protein